MLRLCMTSHIVSQFVCNKIESSELPLPVTGTTGLDPAKGTGIRGRGQSSHFIHAHHVLVFSKLHVGALRRRMSASVVDYKSLT